MGVVCQTLLACRRLKKLRWRHSQFLQLHAIALFGILVFLFQDTFAALGKTIQLQGDVILSSSTCTPVLAVLHSKTKFFYQEEEDKIQFGSGKFYPQWTT